MIGSVKPPAEGTFGRGRRRLYYQSVGDAPGTPVVLVHGLSGSRRWWRRNVDALAGRHTVHLIDLVGYGINRAIRPMGIATAAEAIGEFVAMLPTGRAHLIGHSMGGHIAATLAARFPERVERLILVAASGLLRSNIFSMAMRLPLAAHYSPLEFLPTLAFDALRAGPLSLLLSTRDILGDDLTETLPRVKARTLLVWGSRDNLVPVSAGKAMQRLITAARLEVIEGGGHVVMWDHAEAFNRLAGEFLSEP